MTAWQHSGFRVDRSVLLPKADVAGLERLAEYMVRCPLSLARMTRVTDEGSVSSRTKGERSHSKGTESSPSAFDSPFSPPFFPANRARFITD